MARKEENKPVPLTPYDVRTAVAQMLMLAIRCERYIGKPEKSPQGEGALNKIERIAKTYLEPLSRRKKSWPRDMRIGMCIDTFSDFYKNFQETEPTKKNLAAKISSFWNLIDDKPLTEGQLRILSNVTSSGAPKKTAMINVGKVFGCRKVEEEEFEGKKGERVEEVPSQVWEIYRRYKKDRPKMAGQVLRVEEGITHRSFKEEPTWRFLIGYCFQNIMGISAKDASPLLNHIGDLLAKRIPRGVPPGG